jgi:hypothetical protein
LPSGALRFNPRHNGTASLLTARRRIVLVYDLLTAVFLVSIIIPHQMLMFTFHGVTSRVVIGDPRYLPRPDGNTLKFIEGRRRVCK